MADTAAPQTKDEVLIQGRLYNVAGWRHPGGNIVKFYQGHGDATESFTEFHNKSERAKRILAKMTSREAPPVKKSATDAKEQVRLDKLARGFREFRAELSREGWFNASPLHVAYRIAEIFVMYALGIYLLLATNWTIPALVILGIVQGRCGWLMHEGGHISLTGNTRVDIRLQEFFYGVGCGMSGGWWRSQHNRHHATPQKLHHDVDLETLPLIAFNKAIAVLGRKNAFMRFWIPMQAYLFGPVTTSLVAHGWQLYLHPRFIMLKKLYMEAFWFAVRYAIIFAVYKASGASLGDAFASYMAFVAIGGAYIFTNFSLSHTHLDVVPRDEDRHWVEYASDYTINITPHFFTNWWMGYLNFQIEHHLFPTMPQYKFIKLSPRVKKFFGEHGLRYDVRDYFAAMHDTFANLNTVGQSIVKPQ
jgi:fatty acid desaturase 2 (delta-6 desaturase)